MLMSFATLAINSWKIIEKKSNQNDTEEDCEDGINKYYFPK